MDTSSYQTWGYLGFGMFSSSKNMQQKHKKTQSREKNHTGIKFRNQMLASL